ncbi:flavin-containing monooxygenase [Paenibacillus sp. NPDC058071]|uniref:flavin-containing monooxygenase n=1 Tax=Paenibacillus sp. NPDC058071 TaxID=3346326 RepID=UPI0036DF842D
MITYDVIVIGGGQAGLSAGYFLKKRNIPFIILDKESEAGAAWRRRYDSLVLFTPRSYSSLPGLILEGKQEEYPTKNEVADYLGKYATYFDFPIQFQTEVLSVSKLEDIFRITTNRGDYTAKHVIVTTGPFQRPYIPPIADCLNEDIVQLHTAHYRNSNDLQDGTTLVIGAGNSGAQIAVELAESRDVYLSVGHRIKYMPLELLGRSIFWWFGKMGILSASVDTRVGAFIRKQPDPIFGFELRDAIRKGKVRLKPRMDKMAGDTVGFEGNSSLQPKNIVWATGFRPDYSWICIPGVLDELGKPHHQRGISTVSGLYFIGLPWQYRRVSALIGGVGEDAAFIVNHLFHAGRSII